MSHDLEDISPCVDMTTSFDRKKTFSRPPSALGPQYWVIIYSLPDGTEKTAEGFCTLPAALRELSILERQHFPSTIESIELFQVHEDLAERLLESIEDDE